MPQRSRRSKASGTLHIERGNIDKQIASKKQTLESVWYESGAVESGATPQASKKQTLESVWYLPSANGRSRIRTASKKQTLESVWYRQRASDTT